MIYKEKVKVDFKSAEKDLLLGNRAILEYLENIAGNHADSLKDGALNMSDNRTAWILLDWKVEVLHRPSYGDELTVTTWSHGFERCYGSRYYTIEDGSGKICVEAVAKWILMNTDKWSIARIKPEVAARYLSEPERQLSIDTSLSKLKAPDEPLKTSLYTIGRRDLDPFGHVHNTYYLDFAYEVLPDEVYEKRLFDRIRISYKKEIRLGETICLAYSREGSTHTVAITSENGSTLHAIVELGYR